MTWLLPNLIAGLLIVAGIVGVSLWLVITRPDTAPDFSGLPGWWRARERRAVAVPAAAARPRASAVQRVDRAA